MSNYPPGSLCVRVVTAAGVHADDLLTFADHAQMETVARRHHELASDLAAAGTAVRLETRLPDGLLVALITLGPDLAAADGYRVVHAWRRHIT